MINEWKQSLIYYLTDFYLTLLSQHLLGLSQANEQHGKYCSGAFLMDKTNKKIAAVNPENEVYVPFNWSQGLVLYSYMYHELPVRYTNYSLGFAA